MILYTIMPMGVIFGDSLSISEGRRETDVLEMEYLGEKVQVAPLTNNEFVITRLISSSPQAFLNPNLQPGVVLKGNLSTKNRGDG